jgi:hypothetical protein
MTCKESKRSRHGVAGPVPRVGVSCVDALSRCAGPGVLGRHGGCRERWVGCLRRTTAGLGAVALSVLFQCSSYLVPGSTPYPGG